MIVPVPEYNGSKQSCLFNNKNKFLKPRCFVQPGGKSVLIISAVDVNNFQV